MRTYRPDTTAIYLVRVLDNIDMSVNLEYRLISVDIP